MMSTPEASPTSFGEEGTSGQPLDNDKGSHTVAKRPVRREASEEHDDFNQGTWISLIGLIDFVEMFVTVDQRTSWQRHIAWANKGKDIREYNTKRLASNMVFLSLMLGSVTAILLNSANFSTEMRLSLMREQYWTLKYWMGCTLIFGAVVTVLGLVATYTAWGLIAAISDSNSHAILRSSMGQYVTSLPSKFVVGSLYLYLISLILFILEIVAGPARFVMVAVVTLLFFQVVISLSAFGRLIIHTGAMGKKRVLHPEFERYLLPSGLHASLLIKATERRRRRTSVTSMYKSAGQRQDRSEGSGGRNGEEGNLMNPELLNQSADHSWTFASQSSSIKTTDGDSFRWALPVPTSSVAGSNGSKFHATLGENESSGLQKQQMTSYGSTAAYQAVAPGAGSNKSDTDSTPKRRTSMSIRRPATERGKSADSAVSSNFDVEDESVDDLVGEINFPRPSILNRTGASSGDLQRVVQMALSSSSLQDSSVEQVESVEEDEKDDEQEQQNSDFFVAQSDADGSQSEHKTEQPSNSDFLDDAALSPTLSPTRSVPKAPMSERSVSAPVPPSPVQMVESDKTQDDMQLFARRRSVAVYRQRSASMQKERFLQEWHAEHDARDMYGFEPPVNCLEDESFPPRDSAMDFASYEAMPRRRESFLQQLQNMMTPRQTRSTARENVGTETDKFLSRIDEERSSDGAPPHALDPESGNRPIHGTTRNT